MAGRFAMPREAEYGSNGEPLSGAKLYFYQTQTTSPNDTFSDDGLTVANTNPVIADAAGRFGDIFLKNEDYKVVLTDSDDVTIFTADPVRSAAAITKEVVPVSTTATITVTDDGKLFAADATAGAFTITLPPAATAGDGYEVSIGKVDSSLNAVTVDADGSETINGQSDLELPGRWDFTTVRSDGTEWFAHVLPQTPENTPLPQGHLTGLGLAINGTDAEHDLDIAAGLARDADNANNLILANALTKRLDAAWAVGTGNGGLDTGSLAADSLYYVWLIKRTDTGVVDVLISLSDTTPTMPTSYDVKLRIGAVGTDASSNLSGQITQVFSGGREKFQSALIPIAAAGSHTLTHGMSKEPDSVSVWLQCITDEAGFVAGNKYEISQVQEGGGVAINRGCIVIPSDTTLTAKLGSTATPFIGLRADTGALFALTVANWNVLIRAEAG